MWQHQKLEKFALSQCNTICSKIKIEYDISKNSPIATI